jgi:hypothetical protein
VKHHSSEGTLSLLLRHRAFAATDAPSADLSNVQATLTLSPRPSNSPLSISGIRYRDNANLSAGALASDLTHQALPIREDRMQWRIWRSDFGSNDVP